jgi:hypothetical protein
MTAIDSVTDRIALRLQFAASKAAPVIGNFSVAAAHPLGQVTSGRPHRATKVVAPSCISVINGQAARPAQLGGMRTSRAGEAN